MTPAKEICLAAAELVSGSRQQQHGSKQANFANIAELWNGYLACLGRQRDQEFCFLSPTDVANLFELCKIARRLTGKFNLDDYIDGAGYAACAGELAAGAVSPGAVSPPPQRQCSICQGRGKSFTGQICPNCLGNGSFLW